MADSPAKGLSIGVIMDGNGRWAKKRALPRTAGHKKGADVFDDITRHADELGVSNIAFYAFSTENWTRSKDEVATIMDLLGKNLKKMYDYQDRNNRIVFLGDRSVLSDEHQFMMDDIEAKTADRTGMVLNIAINYSGRQDITFAARELAQMAAKGEIDPDSIDEKAVQEHLFTRGQPMLDLLIRTSGEERISNFMLWQCAYAEMVFTDTLWPDFTRAEFDRCIEEYARRDRRFGGAK